MMISMNDTLSSLLAAGILSELDYMTPENRELAMRNEAALMEEIAQSGQEFYELADFLATCSDTSYTSVCK